MPISVRSRSLRIAAALSVALIAQAAFAQPPAPAKNWQTGEYDMYQAITKEQQPVKRLEMLDAWKQKFPKTDYEDVRQQAYLQTYSQVMTAAYSSQDPQAWAAGAKSADAVMSNFDTLFSYKPAEVSDADWSTAKKQMRALAQNMPGYVALQQKDFAKAETEFTKCLQQDPTQAQVSVWLFIAAASEKPAKWPLLLFSLARSAMYDGEGALDAAQRQKNKADFEGRYVKYHGATDGMVELENLAKANALPPPDAPKILSKVEIAKAAADAKEKQEEEFRKQNPMLALWVQIKTALISPEGASYFDDKMKGAGLPGGVNGVTEFKGKLIEAKPAIRPKELVLSIEDGKTPDVTLKLDAALVGKMEPGAEIGFQGTATAYTASPYMVTFDVEKAKITGWKGGPALPVRTPPRRPVRR